MKISALKFLLFVILAFQSSFLIGQNCDCEQELKWVINTFENNDAGFQYVIDRKGVKDYTRFNENMIEKSKQNNDIRGCQKVIDEWLEYFRKGHLFISTFNNKKWQQEMLPYFMPAGYQPIKLIEDKTQSKQDTTAQKNDAIDYPYIENLSDSTLYLYIPSFEIQYKTAIDSVLAANDALIKKTPNLIIDIRNSGGGSDASFQKIIPYLYTNPIRNIGQEVRATELNRKGYEGYLKMMKANNNKEQASIVKEIALEIDQNMGNFFTPKSSPAISIDSSYTKLPFPRKVGIIIKETNGSADEEFLLLAKQSSKVKLFGTSTFGSLDISNVSFAFSPSGAFVLGYAMTKSYRIPDFCIDGIGLQPDYFIDRTVTDWVQFTKNILEY